jgi:hypothetical protein
MTTARDIVQRRLKEAELLRPQPGDLLVIKVGEGTRSEDVETLATWLKNDLPNVRILILGHDAEVKVIREAKAPKKPKS